jgi:hypothetical protein
MQINPENLAMIQNLLKDAGVPVKEGQIDELVTMLNQAMAYGEEINRQREAELGPEAWAKLKMEMDEGLAKVTREFTEKLERISDSMAPPDKL